MRLNPPTPPPCAECGSDPVHHRKAYLNLVVEELLYPFTSLGRSRAGRKLKQIVDSVPLSLLPRIFDLMERAGAAEYLDEHDDKTLLLAQVLWQEARQRAIPMREFRPFGMPGNIFVAQLPQGGRIVFEGIPAPAGRVDRAWPFDDKALMKEKFQRLGFPVARGGTAFSRRKALQLFDSLQKPVIVKPYEGSASRHTTLHVSDPETLIRAFESAKRVAPFVIIEEELAGPVYRATLVGGRFIASLRRDQAHVIGDGIRTISELIEEANTHPARQGPYFSRMTLSPEALAELAWQNLAPESIPARGARVVLHQKINWSLGGTTADVTDATHPENIALFEEIARELEAPIVGIDFIIEDIGRSWRETPRSGVIECNSMPFFDNHHLPFEGEPRNVASAIWEMMLQER